MVTALEAKLFCLLIIVLLYAAKAYFTSEPKKGYSLPYWFCIFGLAASLAADFITAAPFQTLLFVACAVCLTLSLFFLFPTQKIAIAIPTALVGGAAVFFALQAGLNAAVYAAVFAVAATSVTEQYNRIRIDNLTKLYNRNGFDLEVRDQLQEYKRNNNDSFYVLSCDMDKFKQINDTWGHDEGDRALGLVAEVLIKVGKAFHVEAFRYGGDEFVIIVDTSDEMMIAAITSAIKFELDRLEFRPDFKINMSIGTAVYSGEKTIEELLKKADKKLYEAKKNR